LRGGGIPLLQITQSVEVQLPTGMDQDHVVVDKKMGYGTLGLDEEEQPFCNAIRYLWHRSQHHALREHLKCFFDSFTRLGAGPENYVSRLLQIFDGLFRDVPLLL
jgi:hypothetical protein